MNYISIAVLLLIIFFYSKNKDVISYDVLSNNEQIRKKVDDIRKDVLILDNKNYNKVGNIKDTIKNSNNKYVIITNVGLLNENHINTVLANYIKNNYKVSAFSVKYVSTKKNNSFKGVFNNLVIACINYMKILGARIKFEKDIIVGSKEDFLCKKITCDTFKVDEELSIKIDKPAKAYFYKKYKININAAISVALTVIAGTVITANLIYNLWGIMNKTSGMYDVIACIAIYFCYSNLHSKIYESMGRFKFVASYFFPIYIVIYIGISLYYFFKNIAKKTTH